MTEKKTVRKISIAFLIIFLGSLLSGFITTSRADYYDIYGNYYSDNGYIYGPYGYYDAYGFYHSYASANLEPQMSDDGLRAIDPNGYFLYVPIYYKAKVDEDQVEKRKAELDVDVVLQNPEMPNGCEATATTIALNYYGFKIDKLTLASEYFYQKEKNWDFRNYYIGNPLDFSGIGCYSNAVVNAANGFLDTQMTSLRAFNYTNSSFESLLNEVAKGFPVIIWVTVYMKEPYYSFRVNIDGEDLVWIGQEHCLVLSGFDLDKKTVTVADPLVGVTTYDMDLFKKRFTQIGYNAVILKTAEQQFEAEQKIVDLPFNDGLLPKNNVVRGSRGFDGIANGPHELRLEGLAPQPIFGK